MPQEEVRHVCSKSNYDCEKCPLVHIRDNEISCLFIAIATIRLFKELVRTHTISEKIEIDEEEAKKNNVSLKNKEIIQWMNFIL